MKKLSENNINEIIQHITKKYINNININRFENKIKKYIILINDYNLIDENYINGIESKIKLTFLKKYNDHYFGQLFSDIVIYTYLKIISLNKKKIIKLPDDRIKQIINYFIFRLKKKYPGKYS
jgi:hypothetical protein